MTVSVREAYAIWKRDFRRGRLLDDYGDFNARFREMAYSTGLMALPAGWTLPRWSMFGGRVGSVLGSRGGVGGVLGCGRGGGLYPWYLAGGVSAANCVAAYQPVGASSLAASYTNLATPGTYNAAPGVAPTFDTATGWTFDGTSQYLDTGVVPASGWSMIVRYSDASTSISDRYIIGSTNTNAQFAIQYRAFGSARRYRYGNATAESFNTATYGVIALVASNGYFNGVLDATGAGTFSGTGAGIFIALMRNGPATAYFAGKIQAVAIYNTTLTAPQVAALSSAMSAL